ncbi:MAG: hypothetical protein N5P05_001521 [Chroococcopsis gigantea SAG 12.99]|nr:hypothetical protein [Chroococcopsis gigantea SAG 12.99]
MNPNTTSELSTFLVCGLGSLGQNCVMALKQFGVTVTSIEKIEPHSWEIEEIPSLLDNLVIGDCRQKSVLQQVNIHHCRAALLVTSDEQVNIITALTIRQLNPRTRLVIRSSQENLNELLGEQLGNFIAYEPTQLPANAFALAALGTETLGLFSLDTQKVRVIQKIITADDGLANRSLLELNSPTRRIIAHRQPDEPIFSGFYHWSLLDIARPGNTIVYVETGFQSLVYHGDTGKKKLSDRVNLWMSKVKRFIGKARETPTQKLALVSGLIIFALLIIGTLLFKVYNPKDSLLSALSKTAIILLGGYGDIFGGLDDNSHVPWWLQIFTLGLTLAGTAFVGVLYALLTESLLASKFQFVRNRPPVPLQNHIVIIGLGRVGQQVATLLSELKESIVGISSNNELERNFLPQMPLLVGNIKEVLPQANLEEAKSIVIVTNDEMSNFEIALMSKKINPETYLVIRTLSQQLEKQLTQILPQSHVLGTYTVAAEAFAGASFGENILNLFRLNQQTVLVTEYEVESHDTLQGRSIGDIAYGYRVIPLLHQRPMEGPKILPPDYLMVRGGDRIIILATTNGLRRIEQGRTTPKSRQIKITGCLNANLAVDAPGLVSNICGCPLGVAASTMQNLPSILPVPLYEHQAERLVLELKRLQVQASIISTST